ncbi:hypothetical protein CMUST_01610 [Corynebacterium mustelae]|uniref:Uncharacterized protein n=1 Tax=Corynebacterium mustelae TaxID=571915 RepID=A0A0G3GU55_9CORY|nr:hypothetical protein [Corynebacterium mustelae]AKK04671.1 hypothetical protein CMUST_01610 [Corynebacterium mustelae]
MYSPSLLRRPTCVISPLAAVYFFIAFCTVLTLIIMSFSPIASAQTSKYPLWVGGVRVDDSNSNNVTGDNTVRFDPESSTLYLDGATIHNPKEPNSDLPARGALAAVYSELENLKISVTGFNEITTVPTTAFGSVFMHEAGVDSKLEFIGDGVLTLQMNNKPESSPFFPFASYGVLFHQGSMNVSGPKLVLNQFNDSPVSGSALSAHQLSVEKGEIIANARYGSRGITSLSVEDELRISGGEVTALAGDITIRRSRVGGDFRSISVPSDKLFVTGGTLTGISQNIVFDKNVSVPDDQSVYVNENHIAESARPWDKTTKLGDADSPYRYVRIEGKASSETPPTQPAPSGSISSSPGALSSYLFAD